jgi:hypothetical protein
MTWPRRLLVSSAVKAWNFRGQKGITGAHCLSHSASRLPAILDIGAMGANLQVPSILLGRDSSANLSCLGWNSAFNMEWRKFLDGNLQVADNPSRIIASAVLRRL